ncbi:MAG: hypothetical protein ACFFF9_11765 [Candidatus Thorarchaeota archaeon]
MLKEQTVCPHCGKKSKIEYDPVNGIKKLDRPWQPIIQLTGQNEWDESWKIGIAIECKCKKSFFVYNLGEEDAPLNVLPKISPDQILPVFCQKCKQAFIDPDLICPTCGTNF